jgi:hypothetical protein
VKLILGFLGKKMNALILITLFKRKYFQDYQEWKIIYFALLVKYLVDYLIHQINANLMQFLS